MLVSKNIRKAIQMEFQVKTEKKYKFIEEGEGEVILLLHGLFGQLSNFTYIIDYFRGKCKVVVPILPIFELPLHQATISGLAKHVAKFVKERGYQNISVLGNSLGGHIALMYALDNIENVRSIILTASSGLFEKSLGDTFPKRGDYDFIKKKTEATFFNPEVASKELVDEIYRTVNDRNRAIRIITTAKSAIRNNLGEKLHMLSMPALLIWGKDDTITPPFVGEEFKRLLPNSELKLIEKCGHAPMMEQPEEFNNILEKFLFRIEVTT